MTVVPLELSAIVPAAGGKLAKRPRLELVADAPAPTLPAACFPSCPRLAESRSVDDPFGDDFADVVQGNGFSLTSE